MDILCLLANIIKYLKALLHHFVLKITVKLNREVNDDKKFD